MSELKEIFEVTNMNSGGFQEVAATPPEPKLTSKLAGFRSLATAYRLWAAMKWYEVEMDVKPKARLASNDPCGGFTVPVQVEWTPEAIELLRGDVFYTPPGYPRVS